MLATYSSLARSSSQAVLAYRGRLAVGFLTDIFPLLLMAVWLTVVAGSGPPRGWTASDFIAYYAAATVMWHLSGQHVVWAWNSDLRSGDLSVRLLRPLHPFHQYVADDLGHRVVSLAVLVPALVTATLLLPALHYDLTPGRAVLATLATVLGYAVGVLLASFVGLLGFWSTQTTNVWMLVWGVGSFTSGWVAPVALMPGWVQSVATWLPFRSTLGFPVELWTGRLGLLDTTVGFAVAVSWLLALVAAYVGVWRVGIARYQAVAG